jgi:hypothetical protein
MMPQGGNRMNGTASPELVSEVEDSVPSPRMLDDDGPAPTGRGAASLPEKPVIRRLFATLEELGVNYCHWKSHIRLRETLAGLEDINLLVDPRSQAQFRTALVRRRGAGQLDRRAGGSACLPPDRQRRQPREELPPAGRKVASRRD